MKEGDRIIPFSLPDQDGNVFEMEKVLGKEIIVLFFYPKDNTSGCTAEACAFRDAYEDFQDAGAQVIGISSDTAESHRGFADKHRLPFTLLSDAGGKIRKQFNVPSTLFGLIPGRVTYIIDREGIIRHSFNSQFRPTSHIRESLDVIRKLS